MVHVHWFRRTVTDNMYSIKKACRCGETRRKQVKL